MGAIAKTDVELVEASLRGEHDAFGHLVARYQDVVCAVSYSSTGDRGLSEDVAQETFIAAWRQLDRLRDRVRLQPWLCGIARNLASKARRRTHREELVEVDEPADTTATPFESVAQGDVERVVREALARIPAACREVLVLYYREDCSIREVAETLGLSETAVMQRLSRGRRYLAANVTELVERSLRDSRPRRDLVAAVLASIAALAIPSRVDASPTKGSTMLKFVLAGSALVAAGTAAYFIHARDASSATTAKPSEALHYGVGRLALGHRTPPTLAPTPHVLAARATAVDDLGLLPADSEAVIVVNFEQLRTSGLWKRYVAPKLEGLPAIQKFEALCGFDPLASLKSISIGVKGLANPAAQGPGGSVTGAIVIHGYDKTKAMTCFDKQGQADAEKDGTKVTIDHGVVVIAGKDGGYGGFTFVNDTTALAVLGPEAATVDSIRKIAAGGGALETSRSFADKLQNINSDDSLWLVLNDNVPILQQANAAIEGKGVKLRLQALYGSINITDDLAVDGRIRLDSPATAKLVVAKIQENMATPTVKTFIDKYFDQVDVLSDGADLWVNLAIGGDQIGQLVGKLH
jgi:RNA polymerase sigma factor (sigma-70 family)